jgi:hypothetical protein
MMLHFLFIYQTVLGVVFYNKNFDDQFNPECVETNRSLFSHIESIFKQKDQTKINHLETIGNDSINNGSIGNGTLSIEITHLNPYKLEIFTISDKGEKNITLNFHQKLTTILEKYSLHFSSLEHWNCNVARIQDFDLEIINAAKDSNCFFKDYSKFEKQQGVIADLFASITDSKIPVTINLEEPFQECLKKIKTTSIISEKMKLLNQLNDLAQKIQEPSHFTQVQHLRTTIEKEKVEYKIKANYFLKKTKEALQSALQNMGLKRIYEIELRDVYMNLFSFTAKFQLLTNTPIIHEFKEQASMLIDKNASDEENLSDFVQKIFHLPDDIEIYLT